MTAILETRPAKAKIILGTLLSVSLYTVTAIAQQSYTTMDCRSGTVTVLAKGEDMLLYAIDHKGVARSQDASKLFDNWTQRCVGAIAVIGGKTTGNGWCKSIDPAGGDFTVIAWTSEKPGVGTWRFAYGTGKWKGISGGGEYQLAGATRAVEEGTYQNCVSIKGSFTMPKM